MRTALFDQEETSVNMSLPYVTRVAEENLALVRIFVPEGSTLALQSAWTSSSDELGEHVSHAGSQVPIPGAENAPGVPPGKLKRRARGRLLGNG
jgi:hypothetical protein